MKSKTILGLVIALVVIGAGFALASNHTTENSTTPPAPTSSRESKEVLSDPDDGIETPESMAKEKEEYEKANPATSAPKPQEHGTYINQITVNGTATIDADIADNQAALEQFIVHTGLSKHVLFFHAPWCPFCRVADKAFLDRATDIPAGVAVIKVDYDTHPNLKKLYGVTYQHTFVQVDAEGKLVSKWNGGDIDSLKKYLK